MRTVNISLTEEQAKLVDKTSKTYGFANRSEFVRALLRLVKTDENILNKAVITPFVAPHKIPTIPEIKKKVVPILKKNDVEFAGLFGSYARGEARPDSDLDLIIEYKAGSKKGLFDLVGLQNDLGDALGIKVDLGTDIHDFAKPKVAKDLITIYGERRDL